MSMTIEEAIKRIKNHMEVHRIGQYPHINIGEAFAMAIDALQEKAEREDPAPLTIEELQQMHGEPVWMEDEKVWGIINVDEYGQWKGIPFTTQPLPWRIRPECYCSKTHCSPPLRAC